MEVDGDRMVQSDNSDSERERVGPMTRSRVGRPQMNRRGRLAFSAEVTPPSSKTPVHRINKRKKADENTPMTSQPISEIGLISSTRLKISIRKVHVTAAWKWKDVNDDTCGICRSAFEACCVNCKIPGDECPLVTGACKHSFHMHCIFKWTEAQNSARTQCPLCRQEWKFSD